VSNGSETFDPQYLRELKRKYTDDDGTMTVVLIGKDGGEKYRRAYLDLGEIYRVIDVMPMRMREMKQKRAAQEKMLIDFSSADKRGQWRIINDGVMGGISQSEIFLSDQGTAIFQGTVSLENNGGFASTRTIPLSYNIGGYKGLVMRVKGDGQKYQARLHTSSRFDGISYRHHFETQPDTWMTIRIPFHDFVPVFRGRILNDVPPISPEQIQQIGFLISDKQAGPFRLEIEWIQAYK
jgi:monofunctional biosynthetic peptidoglycan transglycosylase